MIRLLIDMDGPLAAFDSYGWELSVAAGHEFDTTLREREHRYYTDHMPCSRHRVEARAMIESPGWFASLPVTPGAVEGVDRLLSSGLFDVWVCTKPMEANPTCRDDKGRWLRRHFPMLERRLIITPDKSVVVGDLLLDDAIKPEWCARASWRPVCFTEPFNGPGSLWADMPHWAWGDGIDILAQLGHMPAGKGTP